MRKTRKWYKLSIIEGKLAMKKIIAGMLLAELLLIGCAKVVEMPPGEASLFLLPSDLKEHQIIEEYEVIKTKKGLKNLFVSNENSGGELAMTCGASFKLIGMENKASIKTQVSKSSTIERAKELFRSCTRNGTFYKNDIRIIDAKKYGAEESFCIENPNHFYLALRTEKVASAFDIEDMEISESQIQEIIVVKFRNILSRYLK
jgi:hypothetical protein